MRNSTSELNLHEQASGGPSLEERYQALFESAVHGFIHLDRSGHIRRMNGAAEEILGCGAQDFAAPVSADDRAAAIREDGTPLPGIDYPAQVAFSTGREVRNVIMGVYNRRDRAWRWVSANAAPVFRHGEAEVGEVYLSLADITEQRHADAQIKQLSEQLEAKARALEALHRELEMFSYSVSHDLRAPLRSMDGFSRVLLEDYADRLDLEGKDSLNRICNGSRHLSALIDSLLGLARIAREDLQLAPLDVSALAETVVEALRKASPNRSIEFVIARGVSATADARLLQVVLENLLGNAVKFSRARAIARIEFGMTEQAGERIFFVRDNGVGFNSVFAHRLFGAFQHFHSTAEYPGTGIGLATVQRIVHRHGGRVFAESQTDCGATFSFTLPASTTPINEE